MTRSDPIAVPPGMRSLSEDDIELLIDPACLNSQYDELDAEDWPLPMSAHELFLLRRAREKRRARRDQ